MIILDTNVISEPMKINRNVIVQRWLDLQSAESLYITSTSLAELLVCIEILPEGKRKLGLSKMLTELITQLFESRILAFDKTAAIEYAKLVSQAKSAGHIISVGDGQIAAIAAAHGYIVATRDVEPFIAAGVPVINPWET